MQKKGLFFCLPSVSVTKTLTPVIHEIASGGYEVIFYNTIQFKPYDGHSFTFRPYPDTFSGYSSESIPTNGSYFDFGEILIDSATSLVDFLVREIQVQRPDFIIYSHLAVWGKLIAKRFNIPSIALFTTFILDKRIMVPFFRKLKMAATRDFETIGNALCFYRKSDTLYKRLQLSIKPDMWDVYINQGDLNICFILKDFQLRKELFSKVHYLGYPTKISSNNNKKIKVYVSMGTVYNKDLQFYQLCIDVLGKLGLESVIAVGSAQNLYRLKNEFPWIKLEEFVDQQELLRESMLFITRGGMASIHEAIYSHTPMIVIPIIPEQQLNAETIQEAGIGVHFPLLNVNEENLSKVLVSTIFRLEEYSKRLQVISNGISTTPAQKRAYSIVDEFLQGNLAGIEPVS